EAKDELITVEADCKENCDFAMAKLNALELIPYKEKPNLPPVVANEVKVSCGHSWLGGRCETGPDVLHCLFDDPSKQAATNCNGNLIIMSIPEMYKCKDQIGKFKCVKKIYNSNEE